MKNLTRLSHKKLAALSECSWQNVVERYKAAGSNADDIIPPTEISDAIACMVFVHKMRQREAAEHFGRPTSWVGTRLGLQGLDPDVWRLLDINLPPQKRISPADGIFLVRYGVQGTLSQLERAQNLIASRNKNSISKLCSPRRISAK